MSTDRFGGPTAIGAVKAASGAQPVTSVVPGAAGGLVRPAGMAIQASILSRPPDLTLASATAVTGTLGGMTPEGDLPLSTSFGTVLLRPVPGAWPTDLQPGANVALTLGPGTRAGNIQAMAATDRTAATATLGTRPPASGAEAALRGMLVAGAEITSPIAAARPVISTSSAVASNAALPGQVAATPTSNPQLLASAGAAQPPRLGTAVATAASLGPDVPRAVGAAQGVQAVADIAKGAKAGAQDLQQQAALQHQGDAAAPRQTAVPPLTEPPLPPPSATLADPAAPRPDLVLAQALAHPGMVARMAAFLPRADHLGAASLMLYLFGARNGGVRAWLGEEQMRHLTRSEAAALGEVEEGMVATPRMASDGSVWSTLMVPFMDGDRPSVMLLATMPGLTLPPELQREEQAAEQEGITATAFSLGLELSVLGPVQLRGLSLPGRLIFDLSVASLPDPAIRDFFEQMVNQALDGMETRASLRLHWGRMPFLAELMPGGAAVTCDARA